MKNFTFRVITPDTTAYDGQVVSVQLRTAAGVLGVLANHAPFLATVAISPLVIHLEEKKDILCAVGGGVASFANNILTLSTESFYFASELNAEELQSQREQLMNTIKSNANNRKLAADLEIIVNKLRTLNS